MMNRISVDDLRQIPLFAGLPDEQLADLAGWLDGHSREVRLQSRDILYREGELAESFHIVLEGELQITRRIDGNDMALGRRVTGEFTGEMALIRRLAEYPRVLEGAVESHEPHRVAFYLYEVAAEFHGHWNRGKELPQLRFINQADSDSTRARLALVHATKLVLSSGLAILGVSAPEEMR